MCDDKAIGVPSQVGPNLSLELNVSSEMNDDQVSEDVRNLCTWSKMYCNVPKNQELSSSDVVLPGKHGLKKVVFRKQKRQKRSVTTTKITSSSNVVQSMQICDEQVDGLTGLVQSCDIPMSNEKVIQETNNVILTMELPAVSQDNSYPIDDVPAYQVELVRFKALLPCCLEHNIFLLFDFDVKSKSLKVNAPVFIEVLSKKFFDGTFLVYICSCQGEINLVKSTSFFIESTFKDFLNMVHYCYHVTATDPLISQYLKEIGNLVISSNEIPAEPSITEVEFCQGVCISEFNKDFGVVVVNKQKITCLVCKHQKHKCIHTISLRKNAESGNELCLSMVEKEASPLTESMTKNRKPISWAKIPYFIPAEHQEIFLEGKHYYFKVMKSLNSVLETEIPSSCFECGSQLNTSVFEVKCECGHTNQFDGGDFAIINIGPFCVSHFVYRKYMKDFQYCRASLYGSYMSYVNMMTDIGGFHDFKSLMSYQKYRAGWSHFLHLLDIDYNSGFTCPICKLEPKTILCDGTSVSFRRKFLDWEAFLDEKDSNKTSELVEGSYNDRLFIKDNTSRKLLAEFSKSSKTSTMQEYDKLLKCLKPNSRTIHDFVIEITQENDNGKFCQEMFRKIVSAISKTSPICASIFPSDECLKILNDACVGIPIKRNPTHLAKLINDSPILFELLQNSNTDNFPTSFLPVLKELLNSVVMPFKNTAHNRLNYEVTNNDLNLKKISFLPALELFCGRPQYSADKGTRASSACNKVFSGHPVLLPGVFTMYCEHVPDCIIYDNACALHTYCLNREPILFKNTKFLIDRLHWKNHVGCSTGYCLEQYPNYNNINSQINEQINSSLKRIKNSLSYMTEDNFKLHAKLYMWMMNAEKTKKLQNVQSFFP